MKLRIFRNGGVSINGRPMDGLTLQAPLSVLLIPVNAKEVVSKSYVDGIDFAGITISQIVSGYVNISTFKSRITGDITVNGSNQFVVAVTTPTGNAFKLTVNQKGIVTAVTALTASDIPNLTWSKVTLDVPTTAEGYGITNALTTGTNSVSALYTMVQHPASNKEVATKFYVDWWKDYLKGEKKSTGDIVFLPTSTTPTGYLRANGSSVSTTTYAALYAVIGLNGGASPPANTFYLPNLTANESGQYYCYIKT